LQDHRFRGPVLLCFSNLGPQYVRPRWPKRQAGSDPRTCHVQASIVVFLVRATNEPDSLFQTGGSSPSYSRSRRRPPDVWWHRTCVAWRSFRTRGRFACRRRTLALLRRRPPTVRRPAPSSKRHRRILVAETSGRAGEWARFSQRRRWQAARLRRRSSASPSIRTTGARAENTCLVVTAFYGGGDGGLGALILVPFVLLQHVFCRDQGWVQDLRRSQWEALL